MQTSEDIAGKAQALAFLRELERTLNNCLPGPADMESWIRRTVAAARTNDKEKHLRLPEAAFLNGKVLPVIFELIQSYCGLSKEQARLALLNEYHRSMPDVSCASPIRWERHPFKKIVGASPTDIYRAWADSEKGHGLTQSCPDFSLRDPFPHSILFEGKYFPWRSGSLEFAERQLVALIYQAFFYRGLPRLASKPKKHLDWHYEYACLLAFDASPKGTLTTAWSALHPRIQRGFWEGANVYVMILRGTSKA